MEQEQFVASLITDFPKASVIDRRNDPSNGYRAVHIIAEISGKPVEIQVRTSLQHLWAEVSEKTSDVLDPTIKYGGGPESWRNFLTECSVSVARYEEFEKQCSIAVAIVVAQKEQAIALHEQIKSAVAELGEDHVPDHDAQELRRALEELDHTNQRFELDVQEKRRKLVPLSNVRNEVLNRALSRLDELKRQKQ